ncbi:MAG: zf-HC2 domain-containing protein [Acidobacteria bacterium]|nr:zf-HC2 domain-containing protein [Acidobacteriota bacterium]
MARCGTNSDLLTAYVDGELAWLDRLRFHYHLGMCRQCRVTLKRLRAAMRTMDGPQPEPLPDRVRDEILARFADANE